MNEDDIQKRDRLKEEIKKYTEKLRRANNALINLDESCQHEWDETEPASVSHKAYTSPGDPVGTMGVDRQFGFSVVSSSTEKRWKRVCKKCAKIDYTKNVNKNVT